MRPPPHTYTLFPYTTLFRSAQSKESGDGENVKNERCRNHVVEQIAVEVSVLLRGGIVGAWQHQRHRPDAQDRKSTRLNSSHVEISYAVFCLKKKKKNLKKIQ